MSPRELLDYRRTVVLRMFAEAMLGRRIPTTEISRALTNLCDSAVDVFVQNRRPEPDGSTMLGAINPLGMPLRPAAECETVELTNLSDHTLGVLRRVSLAPDDRIVGVSADAYTADSTPTLTDELNKQELKGL